MNRILPIGILETLGTADEEKAEAVLKKAMEGFDRKIVVLDDDPTGVQTVHDISVYTDWKKTSMEDGFREKNSMFFILTNSRSFSSKKTEEVHREIAHQICETAEKENREFLVISRGDSTLRGHYPLETEVLSTSIEAETGKKMDGEIICPFFPEGGRYTFGNVHYVKDQDRLIPAGMTEFGFRSSDLTEYVEEKTKGRCRKEECVTVSLEELHSIDVEGIYRKLLEVHDMGKVIVNAVTYADLKVFCAAFVMAIKDGKKFMARSAAALPKVLGRVTDQPLLKKSQLVGSETNGGIVLIGSHVKKTTDQLNCLKESEGDLEFMEFNVNTCFEQDGLKKEAERIVRDAETCIKAGKTAVIYTSRKLLAPENLSKEEVLKISVDISDAVTSIIGKLTVKPGFIVAKGGITSSDVGTKALHVKKALVMGQVKKGIPVWMTGPESKFPGMPYIIFPGNVGETDTLKEIVEELL